MAEALLKETQAFVSNLLKNELHQTFLYHNYTHTERVYKSTVEIIENSELSEEDTLVLKLTAWLHDIGYTKGCDNHEVNSVKIAVPFLKAHAVDDSIIKKVSDCIMATVFDAEPTNNLEEIIRDADASHFAKPYFEEASEYLRIELELHDLKKYSPAQWREENIRVLRDVHQFYSPYAKKHWQPKKDEILASLIDKNAKRQKKKELEKLKSKYKAQYKDQYKSANPDRSIQTFYRVALRNHIKLSDIADTKANILLSVNAIIISLVLSNLISKLDNPSNAYLIWPTVIFITFSVISMVMSIIATRPNVTRGQFTKEDVEQKRVNLTFFGNFHKMKLDEYQWAINEMLNDKEYVYNSLTKDLYFLGKVLDRKYRILRNTYTVFMVGMIISIVAFAFSFKQQGHHSSADQALLNLQKIEWSQGHTFINRA
ncbi:Pycsar system effector family protein [Winogradskyella aurantiaca]|uniref:Pycsar system effector family protein n=1 Tax=Winogradskyella aurantiaca TaxID=2219558 RepID=UPI000E1CC3BA|nr:Pycsar system effector family protein [Winogradskyella aurantiaca]